VRCLPGVAERENNVIHPDDRERVSSRVVRDATNQSVEVTALWRPTVPVRRP
jgi:hypothetical protein